MKSAYKYPLSFDLSTYTQSEIHPNTFRPAEKG